MPPPALTREDLKTELAARLGLSRREAAEVLESFLAAVSGHLAAGRPVLLTGLGRFEVKTRAPRKGRDLTAGRRVSIPARRRPVFTLSRSLRTMVKEAK